MSNHIEEAKSFVTQFEAALVSQGGGVTGIEADVLKDLVTSVDPDVVSYAVSVYLKAGRETSTRAFYQRAYALASIYQYASDDDALMHSVDDAMKADGVTDAVPGFKPLGPVKDDAPKGIHFQVDEQMLASGDVYSMVRLFAFERASTENRAVLKGLRGKCVLTFDLPDDGKYVWEDARARRVVQGLFKALPYFPYYLNPDESLRHMQVFYLCLADKAAYAGGQVDLSHDSVVKPVVTTLVSLAAVCAYTGEDFEEVGRQVFSAWPAQYVDWLIGAATKVRHIVE